MDDFPRALYRMPGNDVATDSGRCAYRVALDAAELAAALADGWHTTSTAAAEALAPDAPASDSAPPTRAELEQKATELGLKFDGRTGDKKLAAMIADKLGA